MGIYFSITGLMKSAKRKQLPHIFLNCILEWGLKCINPNIRLKCGSRNGCVLCQLFRCCLLCSPTNSGCSPDGGWASLPSRLRSPVNQKGLLGSALKLSEAWWSKLGKDCVLQQTGINYLARLAWNYWREPPRQCFLWGKQLSRWKAEHSLHCWTMVEVQAVLWWNHSGSR